MNPKLDQEIGRYISENVEFDDNARASLSFQDIVEMAYHFANWEDFAAIRNKKHQ